MKIRKLLLKNRGFASLIGLLIAMLIVVMLYSMITKRSSSSDNENHKNESPKAVLDNVRNTVNDLNKVQSERIGE